MFKNLRRFAVVYNGPDFGGIVSFHWTESGAIASKGVGKAMIGMLEASDVINPSHLFVVPIEKKNRNKGTISQGYIVYK